MLPRGEFRARRLFAADVSALDDPAAEPFTVTTRREESTRFSSGNKASCGETRTIAGSYGGGSFYCYRMNYLQVLDRLITTTPRSNMSTAWKLSFKSFDISLFINSVKTYHI